MVGFNYKHLGYLFTWGIVIIGLYMTSLYHYLLFHSLVELFSIIVGFTIFIIAWNSREHLQNSFLFFIGIAYLCISSLDLLHTLSYNGLGIFLDYDYYATQLWIASRFFESIAILTGLGLLYTGRKISPVLTMILLSIVTAVLISSIFYWKIFPVCFIEGQGLTPFKKISEYVICLILLASIFILRVQKKEFAPRIYMLLVSSIFLTIGSELAFTFYISSYGFSNLVGHFFRLFSFFLIYRAIIETGIKNPFATIFRELKLNEGKLIITAQEADMANQAKSNFLASMSHELRTPLNSIIGFTGIILQGIVRPLNAEQSKQLSMVKTSARHLLSLINDILDLSKIDAQELNVHQKPIDFELILEKVVQALKPMSEKKQLELSYTVSQIKVPIISDAQRVEQILINLINNAIKFTEKGSVQISSTIEGDVLKTSIKDTGIGIKEEYQKKVFETFNQADNGLARKYEGTGLGLSICKKLIHLLNGDIWLESQGPGKGSTFIFTLPVNTGDNSDE